MPECCNVELIEVEDYFPNEAGESVMVGFECMLCHKRYDLNGEEVEK